MTYTLTEHTNHRIEIEGTDVQIPYNEIEQHLNELPQDKDREIVCYCKISLRGYEAAGVLAANGWTNVRVLEGGIIAWPYGREK